MILAIQQTMKKKYFCSFFIEFVEINIQSPMDYKQIPIKIKYFLAPFLSIYFPDM